MMLIISILYLSMAIGQAQQLTSSIGNKETSKKSLERTVKWELMKLEALETTVEQAEWLIIKISLRAKKARKLILNLGVD